MTSSVVKRVPLYVRSLIDRLAKRQIAAYPVGGAVRDLLLDKDVHEWDLAAAALPAQVMAALPRAIPTGIKHGTVTALWKGKSVEITSFRGERDTTYSDGRHPDAVRFGVTLEEDLSRRDFTINAMALDLGSGRVIDPFKGKADLKRRLIRCVGDPARRFHEDGLRPLRAIRFSAILGFTIHPATRNAIPGSLPILAKVSSERVRDELLKMLAAEKPSRGLDLLRKTGVMKVVLPELLPAVGVHQNRWHKRDVYRHSLKAVDETRGPPLLRLAALLHDVAKPRCVGGDGPDHTFYGHDREGARDAEQIMARFKFSRAETDRVSMLIAHHMFSYSPGWKDGAVRRFVARIGADLVPDIIALQRADVIARGTHVKSALRSLDLLEARVAALSRETPAIKVSDLAIDGRDVMRALEIPPGRRVGEILGRLLDRVFDDPGLNRRETLLDLLGREAY